MPAQINNVTREKDTSLDTIAAGLNIYSSLRGLTADKKSMPTAATTTPESGAMGRKLDAMNTQGGG